MLPSQRRVKLKMKPSRMIASPPHSNVRRWKTISWPDSFSALNRDFDKWNFFDIFWNIKHIFIVCYYTCLMSVRLI